MCYTFRAMVSAIILPPWDKTLTYTKKEAIFSFSKIKMATVSSSVPKSLGNSCSKPTLSLKLFLWPLVTVKASVIFSSVAVLSTSCVSSKTDTFSMRQRSTLRRPFTPCFSKERTSVKPLRLQNAQLSSRSVRQRQTYSCCFLQRTTKKTGFCACLGKKVRQSLSINATLCLKHKKALGSAYQTTT